MKEAIVLLSGGLDSSTTLAIAEDQGYKLYTLTFNYGQINKYELKAAREVAGMFDVIEHKEIHINLSELINSALTGDKEIPKKEENREGNIPVTYVPARNTIFLSYAIAWGELLKITDVFFGANTVDFSEYPDCRKKYVKSFEKTANLGTKQGSQGNRIHIHTPIIDMSKSEIIKKGKRLGVDFSKTCSCYNVSDSEVACGKCESCIIRKKGFKKAGFEDPLEYEN